MAALSLFAAVFTGCAPSEADIQQEFDDVVAASNACSEADECVLVNPGCPLGCFVAVNTSHKAEVENRARDLIDDYQSGGQSCAYDCAVPGQLACVNGHCDAQPNL